VFGFDRHVFGAHAEYVCWPQDTVLAAMPGGLTHEEAAAIPYGGLLALHFLRRAGVRGGQRVAVYGASGAVGTSAVHLARYFGADVTRRVQRREPGTGQVTGSRHRDRLHRS
jgi:NADPH:quinone reductase-like Zn-dependent oxidoreductase